MLPQHSADIYNPVYVQADQPAITSLSSPAMPKVHNWDSVFNALAAQLPGNWFVKDKGAWGATDLDNGNVYIARRTPLDKLRSVMLHESVHVRQYQLYGGYDNIMDVYGSVPNMEAVTDCAALLLGATWTHYNDECTSEQSAMARQLLGK